MQKRTMKTIWFSLFHFLCTLVMHSLMECFKCVHEFEIFRIVLPSKLEAVSTDSKPLNLAYCTVFIGQKKYFLWNFAKKSSSITSNKIIFIIFLSNEVYKIKVSYQNMFYAYIYAHLYLKISYVCTSFWWLPADWYQGVLRSVVKSIKKKKKPSHSNACWSVRKETGKLFTEKLWQIVMNFVDGLSKVAAFWN